MQNDDKNNEFHIWYRIQR